MVGLSSGYIESLPKPVQERVAFLSEVDSQRSELEDDFEREFKELRRKYELLYGAPFRTRSEELAAGSARPGEELQAGGAGRPPASRGARRRAPAALHVQSLWIRRRATLLPGALRCPPTRRQRARRRLRGRTCPRASPTSGSLRCARTRTSPSW
jgi:hypothetical protein